MPASRRKPRKPSESITANPLPSSRNEAWPGNRPNVYSLCDGADQARLATNLDWWHMEGLSAGNALEGKNDKRGAERKGELHGNLQSIRNAVSVGRSAQESGASEVAIV